MHERLIGLVLNLAREIEECSAAGEYPGAAERAAYAAYGECEGLYVHGRSSAADYHRLNSVHNCLLAACRSYGCDAERVRVELAEAARLLAPLKALAERAEVFA